MQTQFIYSALLVLASLNTLSQVTDASKVISQGSLNKLSENPLLQKWSGPYNGVPPLDKVKIEYFKPALEAAMAENLAEIETITANNKAPDFENTVVALERTGETLKRVVAIYYIWSSNMKVPAFQLIEEEMELKLSAFSDKITQNKMLFQRIEAVYNSPSKKILTPEQQRLIWMHYSYRVQEGAKLNDDLKKHLTKINQQLASLFTRFSQNLLADENKFLEIKNEADLDGLPQSIKEAAAESATRKNLKETWVIINTRSSVEPFLTYANRRDLRQKVHEMFVNRGDNGDAHDNNAIIAEILALRAERAKLLGYPTHAHWRLENSMAKTPERTMELMEAVWAPAIARVQEEVTAMQKLADREGAKLIIEPWDYRYYAEKVRKEKYDFDQNEVMQYLQLEKLLEGMFWIAGELFGFKFTLVSDAPVYHPDVRVWQVTDKTSGKHVGLWYFDPYTREGKGSGAWMNSYRDQQKLAGPVTTIVSNNANFIKGKPGQPILISWDDASTLFHEFGHSLHGLSSDVIYPNLSGTSVTRDYVEFPSQLMERWLYTPELLQQFALHYQTNQPIPKKLVDRITNASKFNKGFITVESLSAALVDMKIHLVVDKKIDPDTFEKETLKALQMPKQIVMRHRTPQFQHIFSSDGYSAGYYSYLWSDVLSADAYQAFTEGDGPYDKAVAKRLTKYVLSVGNSIDPVEAYKSFRGKEPKIDALMIHRGFAIQSSLQKKELKKK